MKIVIDTESPWSWFYLAIFFLLIASCGCAPVPAIKSDFYLKKKYEAGAAGSDGRFNIMACDQKNTCYLIGSFVETPK